MSGSTDTGRGRVKKGGKRARGRVQPSRAHQQVGPALPAAQGHEQHLLDEGQLPLPSGLFLAGLPLGGGLAEGAVH